MTVASFKEDKVIASFIGSGINGNLTGDDIESNLLLIASFIGSGINGNAVGIDTKITVL